MLAGKTIYPFATNGGWVGHTFKDFEKICPQSIVKAGLDVYFDGKDLLTSKTVIDKWISNIK